MAGGKYVVQNKVRPGAYINFKSVPKPQMELSDRGITAMPLELNWGAEGELIDVYSEDLRTGTAYQKTGLTVVMPEAKVLRGALSYCFLARVFRLNKGGVKATASLTGLTVTALHSGTLGNDIIIRITADGLLFDVETYVAGVQRDIQRVAELSELEANHYVDFSGTGNITATAGLNLTGGTNGTVTEATAYEEFFKLLKTSRFQTIGVPTASQIIKANTFGFVEDMRDNEGRYIQAVVNNYNPDYEGVINFSGDGAIIDGEAFNGGDMAVVIAGITAGSEIYESNTGRVILGGERVIGLKSNSEIVEALKNGEMVLSTQQSGTVQIEQDINSLHTFIPEKNYAFSKNRIIRTIDGIGEAVNNAWDSNFKGKVNNNDDGRSLFADSVALLLTTMQNLGAIQNFTPADVTVDRGDAIDAVVCTIAIQPVDSMEKLYMTVFLET